MDQSEKISGHVSIKEPWKIRKHSLFNEILDGGVARCSAS